jgi:hypothetical protein
VCVWGGGWGWWWWWWSSAAQTVNIYSWRLRGIAGLLVAVQLPSMSHPPAAAGWLLCPCLDVSSAPTLSSLLPYLSVYTLTLQDPANEDERIAEAKRMLREADENGDGRISKQVRGRCDAREEWVGQIRTGRELPAACTGRLGQL